MPISTQHSLRDSFILAFADTDIVGSVEAPNLKNTLIVRQTRFKDTCAFIKTIAVSVPKKDKKYFIFFRILSIKKIKNGIYTEGYNSLSYLFPTLNSRNL